MILQPISDAVCRMIIVLILCKYIQYVKTFIIFLNKFKKTLCDYKDGRIL